MALRRAPGSERVLRNSSMLLESQDCKLVNPLGGAVLPFVGWYAEGLPDLRTAKRILIKEDTS